MERRYNPGGYKQPGLSPSGGVLAFPWHYRAALNKEGLRGGHKDPSGARGISQVLLVLVLGGAAMLQGLQQGMQRMGVP